MDKLVALFKRRGFIFPGSDIYGGLANTYDYGPMGTELLRNIKNLWWQTFVYGRDDMVGLDGSIISHHRIWEASGHASGFTDAMVDCKNCKLRMRADHLIENFIEANGPGVPPYESIKEGQILTKEEVSNAFKTGKVEGWSTEKMDLFIRIFEIKCPNPNCGRHTWTPVRKFNLLFPVQLGIIEGEKGMGYLRGETAQMIFVNFKNVISSTRVQLPFGIAQVGKSFRNEITPGNSVFRTIEFEQGEIEYFFDPEKSDWNNLFEEWKQAMWEFVTQTLSITDKNLRWRVHSDDERSFYSKRTEDLEYRFPFGFKELWGLAYRTNYDLTKHQEFSKKDLTIVDPDTKEKILPHVIEPAVGINRLLLMVLCDAYRQEEKRIYLKLKPSLAPVKAAVFPLLANKPELVAKAAKIYEQIKKSINGIIMWDDRGNIGKRYLSQDEIGTPYCITIDFQSLEDNTLTIRDRDTTKQERVHESELVARLQEYLHD